MDRTEYENFCYKNQLFLEETEFFFLRFVEKCLASRFARENILSYIEKRLASPFPRENILSYIEKRRTSRFARENSPMYRNPATGNFFLGFLKEISNEIEFFLEEFELFFFFFLLKNV